MTRAASYSLLGYGSMIAPSARMDAYRQALRLAVRPGSTVLDIGAGTGVFSLLACQCGAAHVHAVEPADAILLGRTIAADNGYAGRITFHQTLSTTLTLDTRADVIVSDLRGITPLFQRHIPSIIDARRRLLADGGVLIPMRDTLHCAIVESSRLYAPYREPWLHNDLGLDMRAGQPLVVNTWKNARVTAEELLTQPQAWATLDYRSIESPDISGESTWTAQRAGQAHGICVWFDTELGNGIGFSNAPGRPDLVYGHAFFPLEQEMAVEAGDRLTVAMNATLVDDDYTFTWRTRIESPSGGVKASFQQSTFYGEVLSLARVKRTGEQFVPAAPQALQIDRHCLGLVDGHTSLGAIAESLLKAFPARFSTLQQALAHAADLFERYAPPAAESGTED